MTNPTGIYWFIAVLLGLLGLLAGWLFGRSRTPPADNRLADELRQQLAQREAELVEARAQLASATSARAAAEASCAATKELVANQRDWYEKALRDAQEAQTKALGELRGAFKALSADTLRELFFVIITAATETV